MGGVSTAHIDAYKTDGSVAQLVEQRPFKPKSHLAPFPKNRVFPATNKDFDRPTEGQPKVKRTYLARAFGTRLVTLLIRPTIIGTYKGRLSRFQGNILLSWLCGVCSFGRFF